MNGSESRAVEYNVIWPRTTEDCRNPAEMLPNSTKRYLDS